MAVIIFILTLLFASKAQADYNWAIPCRTEEQCVNALGSMQDPHFYKCAQGYCLCANLATRMYDLCSNQDMILTAKASGLRRNCTSNDDCNSVEGATCMPKDPADKSRKICLCQPNMVESDDGQGCLPLVSEVGGPCKEQIQCTRRLGTGSECEDRHCRCMTNYHSIKSKCLRNLGYGEECDKKEDGCYQSLTQMGDNLLTCTETYGCRCKKHWTYNQNNKMCEFSGASQIVVHTVAMALVVLAIAFI